MIDSKNISVYITDRYCRGSLLVSNKQIITTHLKKMRVVKRSIQEHSIEQRHFIERRRLFQMFPVNPKEAHKHLKEPHIP